MELWVPGSALDLVGDDRIDPAWVRRLWTADGARLLRVGRDGRLPLAASGLRFETPGGELDEQRHLLIGTVDGQGVFAIDVADEPDEADPGASGEPARVVLPRLGDTERDIATTALALVNWHRVAPHCGVCGGWTIVRQAGHVRHCPTCNRDRFPRTDPAVITAILDADDRLLLAHNANWDANRMSLVAGFVDAGESLEACVRRECREEVGVDLLDVRYVASQPWPFPRSLMLGFVASAAPGEVRPDGVEIDHAEFVSRDDYDAMLADGRLVMPPTVSIAANIIGLWRSGRLRVDGVRLP